MKQRRINAILTIAALALTALLILTSLPLASTATVLPKTSVAQGVAFTFVDEPANPPSGVTSEVDNLAHQLRVVGVANPSTSRYVYFYSDPISLLGIDTTVFEADVSLPTGLRTGIPGSLDPLGDKSNDSLGTPVLFRVSLTWCTFVEISMQSTYGLRLEQVINCTQPSDEISPNGGLARTNTAISNWTGGPVDFDPLDLIQAVTVGAQFHVRLSVDFEQYKVMAEITPKPGFEGNFNPFPPGSEGAIAAPFIAVTNLIDYTKDPDFNGSIFYGIFIRTNGNTDVDDPSAPGGTLRYIDREFTSVQVSFNQPIEFPPIPQVVFPPDDFNNSIIAPTWELLPATGLGFIEEDGILKVTGTPDADGGVSFLTIAARRQDVTVEMDFRAPTGVQTSTPCMFRIQFDPFNYFEIGISNDGYRLVRVIGNQVDATGSPLPLFGDETTNFHRLKLSCKDGTGHVEAFIDNIQLDGIDDRLFSSSFADFRFAFSAFTASGQYIEREWDNFTSATSTPCYDFDNSGKVDVADIMRVASRWRCKCEDTCYDSLYDIDKDCDIDIVDIMKVAVHWGENCG
jgi:hypothetical protein